MTSVLSEFVRQRAESGFDNDKMKEKRIQNLKIKSKIQTFIGLTTFGQEKRQIIFFDFKTKEKLLRNIYL